MIKHFKQQTKKGGASIYVTIFVALIISVVTISFARLAISELSKSGVTDLNQSAYDSALAGVEDAKIAVSNCLKRGNTIAECGIASPSNPDDCNQFLKARDQNSQPYVNRQPSNDGAVLIEEKTNGSANNSGETTAQAYTCVVLNNNLPNYLGELNADYRIRMIPLKTQTPEGLNSLSSVVLSWYDNTQTPKADNNKKYCNGNQCYFDENANAPIPPVIAVSIIQAGEGFTRDNLSNTATGKYGTMALYPNGEQTDSRVFIGADKFVSVVDKGNNSINGANQAIPVKCKTTDTYACSVEIGIPSGVQRYNNTSYLLVATPYDSLSTIFSVEMKDSSKNTINFYDAQVAVDATGRANDVYRRVESRIDMVDIYFPYPLYGLETLATETNNGNLDKSFWVTSNCWKAQNSTLENCLNSSKSDSSAQATSSRAQITNAFASISTSGNVKAGSKVKSRFTVVTDGRFNKSNYYLTGMAFTVPANANVNKLKNVNLGYHYGNGNGTNSDDFCHWAKDAIGSSVSNCAKVNGGYFTSSIAIDYTGTVPNVAPGNKYCVAAITARIADDSTNENHFVSAADCRTTN